MGVVFGTTPIMGTRRKKTSLNLLRASASLPRKKKEKKFGWLLKERTKPKEISRHHRFISRVCCLLSPSTHFGVVLLKEKVSLHDGVVSQVFSDPYSFGKFGKNLLLVNRLPLDLAGKPMHRQSEIAHT